MSQLQEKRRYYQHIIRQESLQKLLSSIRFTLIDPYPPLSSQMNLDKNSAKLLGSTLADKCRIILDFWDKEESCRDDILICICPKFKDWMKQLANDALDYQTMEFITLMTHTYECKGIDKIMKSQLACFQLLSYLLESLIYHFEGCNEEEVLKVLRLMDLVLPYANHQNLRQLTIPFQITAWFVYMSLQQFSNLAYGALRCCLAFVPEPLLNQKMRMLLEQLGRALLLQITQNDAYQILPLLIVTYKKLGISGKHNDVIYSIFNRNNCRKRPMACQLLRFLNELTYEQAELTYPILSEFLLEIEANINLVDTASVECFLRIISNLIINSHSHYERQQLLCDLLGNRLQSYLKPNLYEELSYLFAICIGNHLNAEVQSQHTNEFCDIGRQLVLQEHIPQNNIKKIVYFLRINDAICKQDARYLLHGLRKSSSMLYQGDISDNNSSHSSQDERDEPM